MHYSLPPHFFFFLLHHEACGILVPHPGIKIVLPETEAWSLNHWTSKEVLPLCLKRKYRAIKETPTKKWKLYLRNNNGETPSRFQFQFSHSIVSDPLQPHESQHARPPCPSPTPRVHPNSCPFSL